MGKVKDYKLVFLNSVLMGMLWIDIIYFFKLFLILFFIYK